MKQARVLTQTEIKRLLRVVSTTKHAARNRLVVMLSYMAGLRACEIAALKVGDVINELKDGTWEVKSEAVLKSNQTKGNKAQTVVFSSALCKEIAVYYAQSEETLEMTDFLIYSQRRVGSQVRQYRICFASCMKQQLSQTLQVTVVAGHLLQHYLNEACQSESYRRSHGIAVCRLLLATLISQQISSELL